MKRIACFWVFLLLNGFSIMKARSFMPEILYQNTEGLELVSVERTDTSTTLNFRVEDCSLTFPKLSKWCQLIDELGNCYPLTHIEGILPLKTDRSLYEFKQGADFSLCFPALARSCRFFDFIDGNVRNGICIYGVHKRGARYPFTTNDCPSEDFTEEISQKLFRSGIAVVRGHISNYSRNWGFAHLVCYAGREYRLYQCDDSYPHVAEIDSFGNFMMSLPLQHPIYSRLTTGEGRNEPDIPFYVRPGDTLDIQVDGLHGGKLSVGYASSCPKGALKQLMEHDISLYLHKAPDSHSSSDHSSFLLRSQTDLQDIKKTCDYITSKYSLSAFEGHLMESCATGRSLYARFTFEVLSDILTEAGGTGKKSGRKNLEDRYGFLSLLPVDATSCFYDGNVLDAYAKGIISSSIGRTDDVVNTLNRLIQRSDTCLLIQMVAYNQLKKTINETERQHWQQFITHPYILSLHQFEIQQRSETSTICNATLNGILNPFKGTYVELIFMQADEKGDELLYNVVNLLEDFRSSEDIRFVFLFNAGNTTHEQFEKFVHERGLSHDVCLLLPAEDMVGLRTLLRETRPIAEYTFDRDGHMLHEPLYVNSRNAEREFRLRFRRFSDKKQ